MDFEKEFKLPYSDGDKVITAWTVNDFQCIAENQGFPPLTEDQLRRIDRNLNKSDLSFFNEFLEELVLDVYEEDGIEPLDE